MADLTQDAVLHLKTPYSEKRTLDTSTAQTIYKGQPLIIDQDVDTEHMRGYIDATVVAATDVFMGIAAEGKVVALGDVEADAEIEMYMENSIVGFKSTVFSLGDEGKTVYMEDSSTLSTTAADNPILGTVDEIRDGLVFVKLRTPVICAGA